MSRETIIPEIVVLEEIAEVAESIGNYVTFMVGVGAISDSLFTFSYPQTFNHFKLELDLYQDLVDKYPNGFTKDNLWEYVDMIRSGASSKKPSKFLVWDTVLKSWKEPSNYFELVKEATLKEINSLASSKILSQYPIYKQLNLGRDSTIAEAITMYAYIDTIRNLSNITTEEVNSKATAEDIIASITTYTNLLEDISG